MDDQEINSLIETMVDLSDSLRELRMDARAEGLHMMALNFLVNARTEFPQDRGTKVLQELLRYAQATGSNLGMGELHNESKESNIQTEAEKSLPLEEDSNTQPERPESRVTQGTKWGLLKEMLLGTVIAAGFLWLLR